MSAKFYGLCGIRLEEMVKLYEMLKAAGRIHESEERDQLREAKKHYDRVFPEPENKWGNFIALKNGLWGILNINGKEKVPCIMDHIYERMCSDGVIILEKDGLFGVFDDSNYVYPEYKPEDIELEVEGMVRVRKNGRWGWLDMNGKYTRNKHKACFSNYEDDEK